MRTERDENSVHVVAKSPNTSTSICSAGELAELERTLLDLARKHDQPWAYFVLAGEFVKIGSSRNAKALKQRLDAYRVGSPLQPRLVGISLGGTATERRIHQRLKSQRLRGEWFRLTPEVLSCMRYEGLWPGPMTQEGKWPFRKRTDLHAAHTQAELLCCKAHSIHETHNLVSQ